MKSTPTETEKRVLKDFPPPSAGWYRRNRLISDLTAELKEVRNSDTMPCYELDLLMALTEVSAVQDAYNAERQALKDAAKPPTAPAP